MTSVVVIEDDLSMKSFLKILLELEGFVVTAADLPLQSLLEKIQLINPDILFIDYHLEKITAIDLLNRITKDQDGRPKILVTSGENRIDECIKAGADGFILKPFMPDEVIKWLHNAVAKK